jgi:hypothetical protein
LGDHFFRGAIAGIARSLYRLDEAFGAGVWALTGEGICCLISRVDGRRMGGGDFIGVIGAGWLKQQHLIMVKTPKRITAVYFIQELNNKISYSFLT